MKPLMIAIFPLLFACSCRLGDPDCLDAKAFHRHIGNVEQVFEDLQSGSFPEQYDQIIYDFFSTLEPGKQYSAEMILKQLDLYGEPSAMKLVTTTPWGEIHFEFEEDVARDGEESEVVYRVKLPVCDKLQGIDYVLRNHLRIKFERDAKNPGHWKIPRNMNKLYEQKRETGQRWKQE
jgi:hypothetical protein